MIKRRYIVLFVALVFLLPTLYVASHLNKSNTTTLNPNEITEGPLDSSKAGQYSGIVEYVNPMTFNGENISYRLVDADGKTIILLSAKDSMLKVVEGLNVSLVGTLSYTKNGKQQVLNVKEVIMTN